LERLKDRERSLQESKTIAPRKHSLDIGIVTVPTEDHHSEQILQSRFQRARGDGLPEAQRITWDSNDEPWASDDAAFSGRPRRDDSALMQMLELPTKEQHFHNLYYAAHFATYR